MKKISAKRLEMKAEGKAEVILGRAELKNIIVNVNEKQRQQRIHPEKN